MREISKIPPQAVDIEKDILGALLIDAQAIHEVVNVLSIESFYKETHGHIYKAIHTLTKKNIGIDLRSVSQELKRNGVLDECGGSYYLSTLMENVVSTSNIVYHSLYVQQEYLKRLIIEKAYNVVQVTYSDKCELSEAIDMLQEITDDIKTRVSIFAGNSILESEVKLTDNITDKPNLLSIRDVKLIGIMSRSNFSLFLGKRKARKSFAVTYLAACLSGGISNGFTLSGRYKVSYFDTEQSKYDVQKIVKRISAINNVESQLENFSIYSIKRYGTQERKSMIETVIRRDRPDIIFIDGIRDLVFDFNDIKECTIIVNWIMFLVDKYNCHISLVLHQNPSDSNSKGRGHLGTELDNKCESAIVVAKDEDDESVSIISPSATRGEPFSPIGMRIVAGIPELYKLEQETKRRTNFDETPF